MLLFKNFRTSGTCSPLHNFESRQKFRPLPDPSGRFGPHLGQRLLRFLSSRLRLLPDSRPVALFEWPQPTAVQDLLRLGQIPEEQRHGLDAGEHNDLVCRWACLDGDFGHAPALMQQAAFGMSNDVLGVS